MEMPKDVRMAQICAVHKHRELVPVHVHHIWPEGLGGPDVAVNRVTLCANGHYSVHAYLDLLIKSYRSQVPIAWTVSRLYGRKVRALAQRGFDLARSTL